MTNNREFKFLIFCVLSIVVLLAVIITNSGFPLFTYLLYTNESFLNWGEMIEEESEDEAEEDEEHENNTMNYIEKENLKDKFVLTHVIDNNGTVIKKMAWAGEAVGVYDEDNRHYPIGIEKNGDFIIEEVWTHNEAMLESFHETSYEKNTPILLPIKAGDKWDGKTMQYWPVEHDNMMYNFFGSNGFGEYRSKPNSIGYQIHMIQMYDRMIDGGSLAFGGLDGWIKHHGSTIALFIGLHEEFGFPLFEFKDERAAFRQKMFIRFFGASKKHFEELLKIESL